MSFFRETPTSKMRFNFTLIYFHIIFLVNSTFFLRASIVKILVFFYVPYDGNLGTKELNQFPDLLLFLHLRDLAE